jgi:hypothetical protein
VGKGYGLHSAAKVCGISGSTVQRWQVADPEFRQQIDAAREYCCDLVEHRLFGDAMRGSTLAQLAFLRARRPEFYRAKTVIAGDPEAPLEIAHSVSSKPRVLILPSNDRPAMTEEAIAAERAAVVRENMLGEPALLEAVVAPEDAQPGE